MIHLSRIPKLPAFAAALLIGILLPHESRGEELLKILRQISEEKSGKTSENTSAAAEPNPRKDISPTPPHIFEKLPFFSLSDHPNPIPNTAPWINEPHPFLYPIGFIIEKIKIAEPFRV